MPQITALPAVTVATETDEFPVNQAGTTKKMTRPIFLTNALYPGYVDLTTIADPALPGAGILRTYAKLIAGRAMPKWIGPAGVDNPFQPALFGNNVVLFAPLGGTSGGGDGIGTVWAPNGTVSHPVPTAGMASQLHRTRYANVVTTQNQVLGLKPTTTSEYQFWRGNAAGLGGFFFACRFIVELWPAATVRLFVGLADNTTGTCTADAVTGNVIGLWHDTTDAATVLSLVTRNNTTTTKTPIASTPTLAAGQAFDFYMYAKPNDTVVFYRLDNFNTQANIVDTSLSVTLPLNTVFMGPQITMSNGTANTTVTTTAIGIARVYIETDH
jgi:hypothetical protein